MRCPSAVPALLVCCSLAAASPWEALVLRRRQADPRQAKWLLCVRPGDFPAEAAYENPIFRHLLVSGDFGLEVMNPAVARDLWGRRGWGPEAHWVLLSPGGEEAASGRGRPRGEDLLEAVHAMGGRPRWETREAFRREHPEQGEALLEDLSQAFQALRLRLYALDRAGKVRVPAWHPEPGSRPATLGARISLGPGSQGEDQADDLYGEVAAAFENLITLPGWEQEATGLAAHLAQWEVGQSARMRRLCAQAVRDVERHLRQEPYDLDLADFWIELSDAAGAPPETLSGLCLPLPGEPWPAPEMVARLLGPPARRRDWNAVLNLAADLAPQGPPVPITAPGWENYRRLQGAVHAQQALALAGQGSWDLAGAALAEARRWAGSQGVREALVVRGALFTGPGGDPQAWRTLLANTLGSREAEPPPMPPAEPPLRLLVIGMPPWILPWAALRQAPELALWSPAELHWEVADRRQEEELRRRHGWGPGPRWALFRGGDLRASGVTCPAPLALGGLLEAQGTPILQRLQRVLDAQPDHLAARRERFDLLVKRMPDRRLEPLLAQDAAQILAPLEFDPQAPWRPDPELWGQAALQALPALEQLLRSWPNRPYLWQAWLSWARFHPARPSVLALVQSVSFWSPRGDWRGWLPYEVQRAVAAELRAQGDFATMRDWFRGIWEQLDRRPLRQLHRGERSWVLERRREEETAVYRPLRDALAALESTAELAELERTFGEMVGRAPTPRRK
jgi:hypothetical protein